MHKFLLWGRCFWLSRLTRVAFEINFKNHFPAKRFRKRTQTTALPVLVGQSHVIRLQKSQSTSCVHGGEAPCVSGPSGSSGSQWQAHDQWGPPLAKLESSARPSFKQVSGAEAQEQGSSNYTCRLAWWGLQVNSGLNSCLGHRIPEAAGGRLPQAPSWRAEAAGQADLDPAEADPGQRERPPLSYPKAPKSRAPCGACPRPPRSRRPRSSHRTGTPLSKRGDSADETGVARDPAGFLLPLWLRSPASAENRRVLFLFLLTWLFKEGGAYLWVSLLFGWTQASKRKRNGRKAAASRPPDPSASQTCHVPDLPCPRSNAAPALLFE